MNWHTKGANKEVKRSKPKSLTHEYKASLKTMDPKAIK